MLERLQKILSARGICSRRKAEEYIERGLVTVNGTVASLGDKADPETDDIQVDGAVIQERKELLYYLMNKPVGIVTTNATMGSQQVIKDLLPTDIQGVIYPVGRLDKETSGLILLTNDGVLAYHLTHPKFYHEKEYVVETQHPITAGQLKKLEKGMTISGEKTKPAVVQKIGEAKFSIALTEGKNRQIRRMCQKVGAPVKTLRRVRIVSVQDDALKPGEVRALSQDEIDQLLKETGIENE